MIQDVVEMAHIVAKSANTGIVLFGGGSPKNFIGQACTTASVIKANVRNYKYAVQVVTEFAWHSQFIRTLLCRPTDAELAADFAVDKTTPLGSSHRRSRVATGAPAYSRFQAESVE